MGDAGVFEQCKGQICELIILNADSFKTSPECKVGTFLAKWHEDPGGGRKHRSINTSIVSHIWEYAAYTHRDLYIL